VWFYLYVDGEKAYGSTVAAHGARQSQLSSTRVEA